MHIKIIIFIHILYIYFHTIYYVANSYKVIEQNLILEHQYYKQDLNTL